MSIGMIGNQRSTKELLEFDEVVGEFAGFDVREGFVVLLLKNSCQLLLPSSAAGLLRSMEPGEHIAVLRTDEPDVIRIRRL
jgi:hypothetical protein